MSIATRKLMTTAILGLSLAVAPLAGQSFAQATGDTASGATTGTGSGAGARPATGTGSGATTTERHDDGFDMGWLGLVGLAGLAGLMPKKTHTVTTTTHRPGDMTGR